MNQSELEAQADIVKEMVAEIEYAKKVLESYYPDECDIEDQYIDFLDCDGPVKVVGINFYPSRILSELDPISYRCGLSDYVDSLDFTELDEYKEIEQAIEDLESDLDAEQEKLEELEAIEAETEGE